MHWNNHLYMGEKAEKKRYSILQKIRRQKPSCGIYVITPAANGNDILDIYSLAVLSLPYYRESDLLILGVGLGYWEALEVARQIVDDIFKKTGGLDLNLFLQKTGGRV